MASHSCARDQAGRAHSSGSIRSFRRPSGCPAGSRGASDGTSRPEQAEHPLAPGCRQLGDGQGCPRSGPCSSSKRRMMWQRVGQGVGRHGGSASVRRPTERRHEGRRGLTGKPPASSSAASTRRETRGCARRGSPTAWTGTHGSTSRSRWPRFVRCSAGVDLALVERRARTSLAASSAATRPARPRNASSTREIARPDPRGEGMRGHVDAPSSSARRPRPSQGAGDGVLLGAHGDLEARAAGSSRRACPISGGKLLGERTEDFTQPRACSDRSRSRSEARRMRLWAVLGHAAPVLASELHVALERRRERGRKSSCSRARARQSSWPSVLGSRPASTASSSGIRLGALPSRAGRGARDPCPPRRARRPAQLGQPLPDLLRGRSFRG